MKKFRLLCLTIIFIISFVGCAFAQNFKFPEMSNEVVIVNHVLSSEFKKTTENEIQSSGILPYISKKKFKTISTFDNFMIISKDNKKDIKFMLLGEKGPLAQKEYFIDKEQAYAEYINTWDIFRMDSGIYYLIITANNKMIGVYTFVVGK